jgi:predicted transcriptional regulator
MSLQNGFTKVDNGVIRDPSLSLKEKGLYVYLKSYADNDTQETTVGINRIAAECNLTASSVKRCLESLKNLGFIKRTKRRRYESSITTLLK